MLGYLLVKVGLATCHGHDTDQVANISYLASSMSAAAWPSLNYYFSNISSHNMTELGELTRTDCCYSQVSSLLWFEILVH